MENLQRTTKRPKRKDKIIHFVTGCVRSGTQFLTQVIADRYGIPYLREQRFNVRDYDKMVKLIDESKSDEMVVHCPCLRHKIPEIKKRYPSARVYWLTRYFPECVTSIKKMGWTRENCQAEMIQYINHLPFSKHLFKDDYDAFVVSCYFLGELFFKQGYITDGIIDMEALKNHPSFIKRTDVKKE